jgi:hypothetical protein
MEQTECSETSAYKIQRPGNYPEENIQHTEHGESLKSRIISSSPYNNEVEMKQPTQVRKKAKYIKSKQPGKQQKK